MPTCLELEKSAKSFCTCTNGQNMFKCEIGRLSFWCFREIINAASPSLCTARGCVRLILALFLLDVCFFVWFLLLLFRFSFFVFRCFVFLFCFRAVFRSFDAVNHACPVPALISVCCSPQRGPSPLQGQRIEYKLSDFGCVQDQRHKETDELGEFTYMSPEVCVHVSFESRDRPFLGWQGSVPVLLCSVHYALLVPQRNLFTVRDTEMQFPERLENSEKWPWNFLKCPWCFPFLVSF